MRQLKVYSNDRFAGILTEDAPGKGYLFTYDVAYLQTAGNPVSVTLPLRREPYASESLFPFFVNLLPEGANRRMVCRARHIDETDYFGLLAALAGQDIIGAVNFRRIE